VALLALICSLLLAGTVVKATLLLAENSWSLPLPLKEAKYTMPYFQDYNKNSQVSH
jgi:hypothetical protein